MVVVLDIKIYSNPIKNSTLAKFKPRYLYYNSV